MNRKQARIAGLLYLLASIPAFFAWAYVPNKLIVTGDATATANRVRASETLLRLSIGSELIGLIVFIFVVLALYQLFKPVSEKHALAMATLLLISLPISFLSVVNEMAALIVVSGASFLSAFDQPQLDTLAYLFFRLHGQGLVVAPGTAAYSTAAAHIATLESNAHIQKMIASALRLEAARLGHDTMTVKRSATFTRESRSKTTELSR